MPSLPSLTLPNVFTFIVEFQNITQSGPKWRSTFDIHQTGASPQPTDAIINAIYGFCRANLRTDAHISGSRLRAWSQGPQPFSTRPNLWERSFSVASTTGLKSSLTPVGYGSEAAPPLVTPGEIVLFCKRVTTQRERPSNMFIRGLLDQNDYNADTGGPPLMLGTSPVTQTNLTAIIAASIGPYLNALADPRLVLVHVGNHHVGPPFESAWTEITLVGASRNKQTRKNPR